MTTEHSSASQTQLTKSVIEPKSRLPKQVQIMPMHEANMNVPPAREFHKFGKPIAVTGFQITQRQSERILSVFGRMPETGNEITIPFRLSIQNEYALRQILE